VSSSGLFFLLLWLISVCYLGSFLLANSAEAVDAAMAQMDEDSSGEVTLNEFLGE